MLWWWAVQQSESKTASGGFWTLQNVCVDLDFNPSTSFLPSRLMLRFSFRRSIWSARVWFSWKMQRMRGPSKIWNMEQVCCMFATLKKATLTVKLSFQFFFLFQFSPLNSHLRSHVMSRIPRFASKREANNQDSNNFVFQWHTSGQEGRTKGPRLLQPQDLFIKDTFMKDIQKGFLSVKTEIILSSFLDIWPWPKSCILASLPSFCFTSWFSILPMIFPAERGLVLRRVPCEPRQLLCLRKGTLLMVFNISAQKITSILKHFFRVFWTEIYQFLWKGFCCHLGFKYSESNMTFWARTVGKSRVW